MLHLPIDVVIIVHVPTEHLQAVEKETVYPSFCNSGSCYLQLLEQCRLLRHAEERLRALDRFLGMCGVSIVDTSMIW
jgi:hypothetical protein